jgi:ribonuclease R
MFVMMTDVYCEGMVPLAEMNDDYYVYHQHLQQLIGNNKGKRFKLGQNVKVKVVDTNLERRTIDLSFIE